jgi:hypothetical protein
LIKSLRAIQIPDPVIEAIQHGFHQWLLNRDSTQVRALTAGSLRGPDAVLTSAFLEQFRDIGWYQLCLGRISSKWASAVLQYQTSSQHRDGGLNWSSLFITALWKFSRALWNNRNEVVHGATVEEQAARQLTQLRNNITTMYHNYESNPAFILPRHHYLFTTRTLEDRLKGSYDTMAAWLRTVEEAVQVLQYHNTLHQEASRQFFPPLANADHDSAESNSTYTYHSSSSDGTLSLEPTAATTLTSTSMFSAASSASVIQYLAYESDDESHASTTALDSVLLLDQVRLTMFSAALTTSDPDKLSSDTLSSLLEDSNLLQENASVESRKSGNSSQTSSVDSSLCWANP